jgi:hypothetical protein
MGSNPTFTARLIDEKPDPVSGFFVSVVCGWLGGLYGVCGI